MIPPSSPRRRIAALKVVLPFLLAQAVAGQTAESATRTEAITAARKEKAARLQPEEPTGAEKALLILKERQVLQRFGQGLDGLLPKFGGLATGQGLALGVQYNQKGLGGNKIDLRSSAVGSLGKSYKFDLGVAAPRIADGKVGLDFLAEHANLARVDFYGLGRESRLEDRTSFRYELTSYDGAALFKPAGPHLQFGFKGGLLQANTGPGNRSEVPSTEELFSPAFVPGLEHQTDFFRGGGLVRLEFRDNPAGPRAGSMLSAAWSIYRDLDLDRHDFQRLDLEGQQYIPLYNKRRVIVLRARSVLSFTKEGQTVPFYLKPWIGGPTELRGFRNYRFYDDNVLMLNAEYRWEAFSGLDMALFFDAGQVAHTREEFDLSEMETAAGFGFRFNVRNATFLRLDFGFSHEGFKMWFRFGNPF
jgi:outer membrane protein assembly factor BamA